MIDSDVPGSPFRNFCTDVDDAGVPLLAPGELCDPMILSYSKKSQTRTHTGKCDPFYVVEGSDPFPSDLECWTYYNEGIPQVRLEPGKEGLPAGRYIFEL